MIRAMAIQFVRERYVGTVGGVVWTVLQPLLLVATYWFVFTFGFKLVIVTNVPFVLCFIAGLAPWLLFAEALTTATGSVVANGHLIRKMVFPSEILPVVHLLAATVVHLGVIAVVVAVVFAHGRVPGWAALQLPYYGLATLVLALGLGWLLAALQVFFRDVARVATAVLNIWFWLTPVVWPLELVPERWHSVLALNPAYYVVQGYRDTLLYDTPFWARPAEAAVFWFVALSLMLIGAAIFRRLKPEFAEVL